MNPTFAGILALAIFSLGTIMVVQIETIPSFALAAIAMGLGGTTILLHQFIRKEPIKEYWKQSPWAYLWVITGIGLYTALILLALKVGPAFEVNALNYSWPILLVLFSALFYGDQLGANRVIGIGMGFIGTALILLPQGAVADFNFSLGHGIALFVAFLWAGYCVYARHHPYPSGFIAPAFLISAAICWVLHLLYEPPLTTLPPARELFFILAFGMTRFCYVLWDYGMKKGDVVLLGSLSYFVPLISVSLFVIFGYRAQTSIIELGAALIVLGCLVVNIRHILKLFLVHRKKQA